MIKIDEFCMNESKFLTDSKNLNIAIIFLFLLDVLIMIMGILYVVLGTFQTYHIAYIGMNASKVRNFNPELMILISFFIRLIGFCFLSISIGSIIVIYTSFRKREKWSWIWYLIEHILIAVPLLWITYIVGGLAFIILIVGWIFFIIGMTISYKDFF